MTTKDLTTVNSQQEGVLKLTVKWPTESRCCVEIIVMAEMGERTLEDIKEMLNLAKLTSNDTLPTSQSIYFSAEQPQSYKFLELDDTLLENLKEGQILHIKGDDDENAVICSNERTYDVTNGETSNSLLLVENLKFYEHFANGDESKENFSKVQVVDAFSDFLTVALTKPHLKKFKELLNKSVYKGPECEYEVKSADLYSFEDFSKIIQASDVELKNALDATPVVTINNKIRLLDFEYHFRALSYMLKLIDENSWPLDEIDFEETLSSLEDIVPKEIVMSLFDKYCVDSKIIDGLQLYSYNENDVCKFFAQVLLHGVGKFNLEEFLQAWSESVPEGMQTSEELLYGIALIDRKSTPNVIYAFEEEDLPDDINQRFDRLFKVKEKWSVPEITPYIQPLATEKLNVNALLAKYARASNSQGVKYYSAKHGK